MARIRSIKPEFWTSEQVMECSPLARLLFIGMWNFADDLGRLSLSPKMIKAQVFPSDEISSESIRRMIDALSSNGLLLIYEVNGREYVQITGWQHQKIDRPQPGKCPAPTNGFKSAEKPAFDEHSTNDRRMIDERSPTEGKGEDRKGEEKKETRASALAAGWPADFRDQFWQRYPHKVGKPKAIAKLELAMKRGVEWQSILEGLDRYVRAKPADRPWLNPETFINQERWTDQPAGSVPVQIGEVDMDWDREMERFKRGMPWSKWGGPEPGMAGCKVPPSILIKYGYGLPDQHVSSPQLRSMGH